VKSLSLIIALLLISHTGFAKCFYFVDGGNDPKGIGNIGFSEGAKEFCVEENSNNPFKSQLVFLSYDRQELLKSNGYIGRSSCGPKRICLIFNALSGEQAGVALTQRQSNSIEVHINAKLSNLNVYLGTFTDKQNDLTYLIMGKD